MKESILKKQIRNWLLFFIVGIALSGITAFPIESELLWLNNNKNLFPDSISDWIQQVYNAIHQTNSSFPFIAYGTDWLAFAHIIIAILFIGPLLDPIKNKWIIEWGMICCILVIPLAFIAGPIRGIPFFHQLIDCSFGVIGIIPLAIVRNKILLFEKLIREKSIQ